MAPQRHRGPCTVAARAAAAATAAAAAAAASAAGPFVAGADDAAPVAAQEVPPGLPGTRASEKLMDVEPWWSDAVTHISIWDQSWLTPRLICGIRLERTPTLRTPEGDSSGAGPVPDCSAALAEPRPPRRALRWVFDGTAFQQRALEFYEGVAAPPMQDVWLVTLLARIPGSWDHDVTPLGDLMELECRGVLLLAAILYSEYLAFVAPAAVLLKSFQFAAQVHEGRGLAFELASDIDKLAPVQQAGASLHRSLQVALAAATKASQAPPLVDVVVAHCREDLGWARAWLRRVLRDEWTPEVRGLRLRLLIFERCAAEGEGAVPAAGGIISGQALIEGLLRLGGAVDPGSAAVPLPEPPGFENVAYVHYCRSHAWRDAEHTIFLHGAPFDHLEAQMLYDVLRALALGTYSVPFLHLNAKRLPLTETEKCVRELLQPATAAWSAGGAATAELPTQLSSYCCSQFVVSRARLRRVPDSFWDEVWRGLTSQRRGASGEDAADGAGASSDEAPSAANLPASCRASAWRIFQSHHRHRASVAAEHGVWAVVLERLWHWVFGEEPRLPVRDTDPRLPLFLRLPRPRATGEGGPRGTVEDHVQAPDWGFDPGWWGSHKSLRNVTEVPMVAAVFPVPTSLFASAARDGWELPPWVKSWFEEEPPCDGDG